MKRGSKETRRRLYQAEILEIYLLLYIFVKFQVFPPTSSRSKLYDLSFLLPPYSLSYVSSLSLVIFECFGLSRHLDRCICAPLCRLLHRTCPRRFLKTLTSPRLHQISRIAEHLLNLLTLWASRWKLTGKSLLPLLPAN